MSEEVRKSYTDGMCVMIDDRLPYDCAEIHGFICGLIAGGCPNDHHEFLKHISSIFGTSEEGFSPAMKGWLIRFFALVYEEFVAEEELTIPFEDDTTAMEKSLYRVSEWSDNFMSGFSSYHHSSGKLSKDMEEIFRDLSAITSVDLDAGNMEQNEFDENYTTICEHLKSCAQLGFAQYGFNDPRFGVRTESGKLLATS